jgi:hypothetical protein
MPALPATWTTIASRERFPALTEDEKRNINVAQLWIPTPDALLTQEQAHELALQGRVWIASHYDETHQHFQVMARRLSFRDLVRKYDFGEKV